MPSGHHHAQAMRRGLCFDLGGKPGGLFVPSAEIQEKVWDPFAPVWGPVVKYGCTSQFDEITYAQMLDDAELRGLRIYMDQDHRTASACWSMGHTDIPALAYYCNLTVTHAGKVWRALDLAGHSCAAAAPLDPAANPEGLHGFRCRVTPLGRAALQNYQALSIHFDPFGEDMQGHPVGQVLICVSAVNGPQIPGARPAAGQFSNVRYFDMSVKKRKLYALAKDEGGDAGGDGAAETKDLSAEMAELAKCLGMPEGSAPEAIIGAALAVIKAGKPAEPDGDGDEPLEGDKDGEQLPADALKYMEDEKLKGYARRAALRFARPGRLVGILGKELGCKANPRAVLQGFLAFKAKSVDSTEFASVSGRLKALEDERAAEKALARETAIRSILDGAKEGGLISEKKREELYSQAERYKASPDDVKTWLPDPDAVTFTAGGRPAGKKDPPSPGGSDRVRGGDHAAAIDQFRGQYQKDSGKRLRYVRAAEVASKHMNGGTVDYAAAKAAADRLPADAFLEEAK